MRIKDWERKDCGDVYTVIGVLEDRLEKEK